MNEKKIFNLHLVSDATGETLLSLSKAVVAQYSQNYKAVEFIYSMIRTIEQIDNLIDNVNKHQGIVLYTMVNQDLAKYLENKCAAIGVHYSGVLDPIFSSFENYLHVAPNRLVSAQHALDEDYFKRQEAINYSLDHDDGQLPNGLAEAEVILLGISRTSKTPTSLYLANRGIKAANVPIVLGIDLPKTIFSNKNAFIVGLVADATRIEEIRKNRVLGSSFVMDKYSDNNIIREELSYSKSIFKKYNIPYIDVTNRAVEETAATIISMINDWKQK